MASHHQPPTVALNELLAVVKTARALLEMIDGDIKPRGAYLHAERNALRAALAELDKQP